MRVPPAVAHRAGWPATARRPHVSTPVLPAGLAAAGGLATASLLTQVYWLATGDPLALGLVPAFNPAGVGNLPAFAASAALAACAALTAVLAGALHGQGLAGWRAWTVLAAGMALLSLQRLAVPRPRAGGDPPWLAVGYAPPAPLMARDVLLAAVVVLFLAAVAWAWRSAGASRAALLAGAGTFGAGSLVDAVAGLAAGWFRDPSLGPALLTVAARALELAGIALVGDAVLARLTSVAGAVRVEIEPEGRPAVMVAPRPGGLVLRVVPWRVQRLLLATIAVLVATSVVATWAYTQWPQVHRLYRLFYVDFETNVPTWWSANLLLASGAVAAMLAARSRRAADRRWLDWLTLAGLLVAMATDEAASLHELLQKPVRSLLGADAWLRYPLVVPGGLAGLAIALRFRGFLRTLGATRYRLILAAALYGLGALGLETMGGWFAPEAMGPNTTYVALTTIEETLEMTGASLVLLALLRHAGGAVSSR